jgi:succinyldiaminopimelate transaminase
LTANGGRAQLPDFPWDLLAPFGDKARQFPDGLIDLSVGTPVDPTPITVRDALAENANAPGYPTTAGTPELIGTIRSWAVSTLHAPSDIGVLPTIGSKEIIAMLPTLLGCGEGDHVVIPAVAYPTYAVGAIVAGATFTATDSPELVDQSVAITWLNSPSNPTGAVLSAERLRELVSWAQSHQVTLISDECYFELGWDEQPISILDQSINGGNTTGLLAVHSLSKRSNMAGYRFGFVAGDQQLVAKSLATRKHLGMMVPTFVQHAALAAYSDPSHVQEQRSRYAYRREVLWAALASYGFDIHHSEAGLYLWGTLGENCWDTVGRMAELGILATPGVFYGENAVNFVRFALTATDSDIDQAVSRLAR